MKEFTPKPSSGENVGLKLKRTTLNLFEHNSQHIQTESDFIRVLELKPVHGQPNVVYKILLQLDKPLPGLMGWDSTPPEVYKFEISEQVDLTITVFKSSGEDIVKDKYTQFHGNQTKMVEKSVICDKKESAKLFRDLKHSVPAHLHR